MAESYTGTRFRTVFVSSAVPRGKEVRELRRWCGIFARNELAPEFRNRGRMSSAGNLSARLGRGFAITAAGCNLARMSGDEVVRVIRCDAKRKVAETSGAREPSSETMLHWMIYGKRPDVNFVFHGHDSAVMKNASLLGLAETEKEMPYGSLELVREVEKAMEKNPDAGFIVLKNHGFVAFGAGADETGRLALEICGRARAIETSKSQH
ncbi:MAG: class II aldolase/adducin family protein [Candidatus Micrarchaeota archaeon]